MLSFNQLKKNLKKDTSTYKTLNVSVLGENANQLLCSALKGWGVESNYNVVINECGYDEIDLQVSNANSQLYNFQSDYILIFPSVQKLIKKFYNKPIEQRVNFAEEIIKYVEQLVDKVASKTKAKIIFGNYLEINDAVFGNYANKNESSFLFQLRKLNMGIMILAQSNKQLHINDILSLQNQKGIASIIDDKFYVNADLVFSLDFLPYLAKNTFDIINALEGKFNKCLVLDLDNTLWGGTIGDDGLENIQIGNLGVGKAFTEFQQWIKQLKERGIILTVCSKNSEEIAKEPFEKHPEMILRLDDFAIFVANWESKVDNIKYIQSILNIGFDSIVFLDDNPFERNIIRENIEHITVPELPEDPSNYLTVLKNLNLFETVSFTYEDRERTTLYRNEAKRTLFQKSFENGNEYLKNLNMISQVQTFSKFNIPRVAQLSQRSNQFNLRTIRYSEKDLETISISPNHLCLAFSLSDKFGENGLISVIILEKINKEHFFINTWLMSCRVLKRGMENFMLNTIAAMAKKEQIDKLIGEYIPTKKNKIAEGHYENLGFIKAGNFWELELGTFNNIETFINKRP